MTQAVAGGKIAPPRSLEASARFDGRTPRTISSSNQTSQSNFLAQLDTAIDKKISGRTSAAKRDVAELQDDAFKRKAVIRKKNDSSRNEVDQQRERSIASSNEARNARRNASSNDSNESSQSIARGRSESADLKQSQRTNEKEGSRSSDEADGPTDFAADLTSDSQSTKTSSLTDATLEADDGEVLEDLADSSATSDGTSDSALLASPDSSDAIAKLVEATLAKPQQVDAQKATEGSEVEGQAVAVAQVGSATGGSLAGFGDEMVGATSAKALAQTTEAIANKAAKGGDTSADSETNLGAANLETTLDGEVSSNQADQKVINPREENKAGDQADDALSRVDASVRSLFDSTAASTQSARSDGQSTSAATSVASQPTAALVQPGSPGATTTSAHVAQHLTGEAKFAQQNVDQIVQSVRSQAMAKGGEMQLRLDPPELGILQVSVKMTDGVMSATFTTENANATQALSHSMQQLKQSLEAAGIAVDRIQVRQNEPAASSSNQQSGGEQSQHRGHDQQSHQNQQERREMVRQMWRRVAMGQEAVDVVA